MGFTNVGCSCLALILDKDVNCIANAKGPMIFVCKDEVVTTTVCYDMHQQL